MLLQILWKQDLFESVTQMMHGRRQLVSWDVRLSPVTSATQIFSYLMSKETAQA